MNHQSKFDKFIVQTPAFIYDHNTILQSLNCLGSAHTQLKFNILFSIKSFSIVDGLGLINPLIDGFSSSSLFEARLAREVLSEKKSVHIATPGFRSDEFNLIVELCDFINFNSLSQLSLFGSKLKNRNNCGLRINPQLPFVRDSRYNPCRKHSKLGVPLNQLIDIAESDPSRLSKVNGLLFHSNCDSADFMQLLATVKHIDAKFEKFLPRIRWINLGGGYLFNKAKSLEPFYEAVHLLKSKYDLDVLIEPGASVVREAGCLVSTVLDVFDSEGKTIVILDTTVNHMPEVFEYQFEPDVVGHKDDGRFNYILAGCSCLAGDVFGEYAFDEPLKIGSRVIFENVGAYTLVKAHMFNGINLPSIYAYTTEGKLELKKQFTYEDFKSRCGANNYVTT